MVFVDKAYQTALGRIEAVERSGSSFLDLRNLKLRTLPSEIGKLSNIEELYINLNMLTSIPPEIGKLANLKKLYVNSNRLKSIPPEIGNLISLEEFFISNNELNFIPQEIGNLTELKTLDLHDNRITILPSEIKNLKKLKRLDLQRNRLSKIPEEVFDLSMPIGWNTTKGLDVDNNPLTSPPIEVFKQGVGAVRAYFKEIGVEETVRLFEAKMLIVGQGSVGKTYLMKRLIYDDINSDIISTEGIDIDKWLIKTKQTEKFLVNFWDFGGQEIYHATHQFFLTKRSLYLFVWEARTDADLLSFDYWLNTVKVLSASSPVIVIQNKIDERKKSINQDFWKKLFPNIVEYHDVSAIEAIGVDGLKLAITREIEKLPHIGDLLPKRWIIIRQQMEKLDVNFITYSQYKDICTEFGMNEAQADRLSEYYHDLGVFLNFKQNPILRHTIFLKPEWATNAVYKVIDNPSVKDNYGKFHFRQLTDIWRDKREFPVDIQIMFRTSKRSGVHYPGIIAATLT
jgi:small GTP-binding protein